MTITSGGKAAKANQFKGERKVHEGVGKTWYMDENGNPVAQKPKKKAAVTEIGPTRRANARERKLDDNKDLSDIDIKLNRQIFSDFSAGQSKLGRDQLERMLEAVSGVTLHAEELDYILMMADRNKDGSIDLSELSDVQEVVSQYLRTRHVIAKIFKKYDVNNDGGLEYQELRNLLTELNDGVSVAEDEVTFVMNRCANFGHEQLKQVELERAINFWYNYTDDPPDNILLPKDRRKGGVIGRAMTGMHHHDKHHFEEHHDGATPLHHQSKAASKAATKASPVKPGAGYTPTSEK